MSDITAVGFDLDGTLFDHRGSAVQAVDSFARRLGIEPNEDRRREWFAAEEAGFQRWSAGEFSFQEQRRHRLRSVLPAWHIAAPETDGALDALFDDYLAGYRASWRAFPGAEALLRSLREQGFAIGVLTNGAHEQQHDKLQRLGLDGLIDVICTAEDLGLWKPDPRAFAEFARLLGVEPSAIAFVGDDPEHDIRGAAAVGMTPILVDHASAESTGFNVVTAHPSLTRTSAGLP